ncbi:tetratricopeptide repeat protein [Sulfobacillus sp. DSM 109850]|uniref:Tetratricopeptide repeat protein n=2 Tax=Sulfobacillus harzensis TaxID=2729629 RepID=A0A7Y0Q289_9FIRM|nr:tetratricopeptide repeat protein [Sulfobacillus harzensis]
MQEGTDAWTRGDRDTAERAFNRLLDEFPERPEGYNKVGVILADSGQLDEAEKYFLTALKWDRKYAPALTNLGNIYLERGEVERSIQHYLLALDSDPEYPPAHRNLSVAYRRQGRYSAFVSHYKRSQRLDNQRAREEIRRRGGFRMPVIPPVVLWVAAAIGVVVILTVVHR